MRRRVITLLALAALGVVVACAPPAFAIDAAKPSTTVRTSRVTVPGRTFASGSISSAQSVPEHTNLVGIKWSGDGAAELMVETRAATGRWTRAGTVAEADGGPDQGTAEAMRAQANLGETFASDPLEVHDPGNVRVRVKSGTVHDVRVVAVASPPAATPDRAPAHALAWTGAGGAVGAVLALGLVLPGSQRRRSVAALVVLAMIATTGAVLVNRQSPAGAIPGQPRIVSRAEWGADESLRLKNCPEGPNYAVPRIAVIHHTVNSNSYTPAGAIGLVRSIYAYHTVGRNYCDVGYNFLVDRFGTIYEGRYGGVGQGVIGAHATNFNTNTFGVAMIGDFSNVGVSGALLNALTSLVVWKMSLHRMIPTVPVSKFGVWMDPIIGHRDAGRISGDGTACPGNGGYAVIGALRQAARAQVQYGDPIGNLEALKQTPRNVEISGWATDPETVDPISVHVYVDGVWRAAVLADGDRPDVEKIYSWLGRRHGYTLSLPVPTGVHTVCVYAISVGTGVNPLLGCLATTGQPIGNVESAVRRSGAVRVKGWALDPDLPQPIAVHVYVDLRWGTAVTANLERPDVAEAYPAYGARHGFNARVLVGPGRHVVCVYGISRLGGANSLIRCRTV